MVKSNNLNFIVLIALIASFFSCEEEINLNLNDQPNMVVLNGLISPDSTVRVYLTNSRLVTNTTVLTNIRNADVKLYGDGQFLETLSFVEPPDYSIIDEVAGFYKSTITVNRSISEYTIKASVPNRDMMEATTSIPEMATGNIQLMDEGPAAEESVNDRLYNFKMKDASPERNYYQLVFKNERHDWTLVNGKRVFSENFRVEPVYMAFSEETSDIFTVPTPTGGLEFRGTLVVSDDFFANDELDIHFTAGESGFSIGGTNTGTVSRFKMEVRNIGESLYKHLLTRAHQDNTRDNPFTEPVQIFSNVKNGLGIFAGYNPINSNILVIE